MAAATITFPRGESEERWYTRGKKKRTDKMVAVTAVVPSPFYRAKDSTAPPGPGMYLGATQGAKTFVRFGVRGM